MCARLVACLSLVCGLAAAPAVSLDLGASVGGNLGGLGGASLGGAASLGSDGIGLGAGAQGSTSNGGASLGGQASLGTASQGTSDTGRGVTGAGGGLAVDANVGMGIGADRGSSAIGGATPSGAAGSNPAPGTPSPAGATGSMNGTSNPAPSTAGHLGFARLTTAPPFPGTPVAGLMLPIRLVPLADGPGSTNPIHLRDQRIALRPFAATPLKLRAVVIACRTALAQAAASYGATQVDVAAVASPRRGSNGGMSAPMQARIVYAHAGRIQVRQGRVTCLFDQQGQVVAAL